MKPIEQLYREIAPRLTNYLVGGGLPHADACEIVQESFLRIWKMRDSLKDDDSSVSGLVYTIARNLRNDRIRAARREILPEQPDSDPDANLAPSQVVPGLDQTPSDRAYLRGRLLKALGKLPDVLRETYVLFQVSEMSVREIASLTNVTENLVKVRIHRAKLRLRGELADLKV